MKHYRTGSNEGVDQGSGNLVCVVILEKLIVDACCQVDEANEVLGRVLSLGGEVRLHFGLEDTHERKDLFGRLMVVLVKAVCESTKRGSLVPGGTDVLESGELVFSRLARYGITKECEELLAEHIPTLEEVLAKGADAERKVVPEVEGLNRSVAVKPGKGEVDPLFVIEFGVDGSKVSFALVEEEPSPLIKALLVIQASGWTRLEVSKEVVRKIGG
ncbi:hypothetical protein K437DRAFT_83707 [Tilletiaria anomala UBC 951]|uniref:Uncharacterized protein n=1 Tax=Tilletiaria anomala (strain ATCC 24038 / CBS 436.72 / UBC 951) TaxID=1037660 RepID=A0A066W458_TILAU|nr:uncharacterized protein K437DRAFT_83707 [Tilletiaria anomala UBC 951]KDN48521.1 hypothetical protein K437DRAFT_83707 [Tilletiaria anomala UBC 951]